ncbi:hypothetical protein OIU77_027313 [Salix suchowensis]|uniref:Uncharacterized protein n=1 Tax=Salix suchowensis TaxID=1278906 RepID=A0ABQ9BS24_9ROSI|nr:hypothetical protein OIU77_027313 [Salix suchowensis]
MPQEASVAVSLRRNLSRRRSFRSVGGVDRDDRGWTLLHIGARKGDLKQVKRLLDEGMDVNVPAWGPKSKGLTPLHLAAQGGHLEIMAELLERGLISMLEPWVLVVGLHFTVLPRRGRKKQSNFS